MKCLFSSNVSYHGVVEQKLEQEKKRSLVEGQPGAPPTAVPPQQQLPPIQQTAAAVASQPQAPPPVSEMPPPSHYPTPQLQQNYNGSHRTSVASTTPGMQQCRHKFVMMNRWLSTCTQYHL